MKIALLTSGGDAPGMNAAIRAVVRTCGYLHFDVFGYYHGFNGLLQDEGEILTDKSVENIINRGGTILKTARCPAFLKAEAREKAYKNLLKRKIDGLVIIGGDGSFAGAKAMQLEHGLHVVGVPGTIDNDIAGSDLTIGFDTACNTALEAIDKIRDTAGSHDRLFFVEVMGHTSNHIAIAAGIAAGADMVLTSKDALSLDEICRHLTNPARKGHASIVVVAEAQKPGRAFEVAKAIQKRTKQDYKVCILGHIQRGGTPTATDRLIASKMGHAAVVGLSEGNTGLMTAWRNGTVELIPFPGERKKPYSYTDEVNLILRLAEGKRKSG